MAEGSSSKEGPRKTVLVCLGERKREVCFGDGDDLLEEVVRIYKDVLPAGVGCEGITLQLKREDWSGEFVDVTPESVTDKCVLKVILPQPITYLKEKSNCATSKALSSVKKLSKPSAACTKALSKMFPSSKPVSLPKSHVFDPLEPCVVLPAQKKKKASISRVKPITITVILIPNSSPLILPRGKKRLKLNDDQRIEYIEIKRTMSPQEVRASILSAFKTHHLTSFDHLDIIGGRLVISPQQEPDGESITNRRGALYIKENVDKPDVIDKAGQQTTVSHSEPQSLPGPSSDTSFSQVYDQSVLSLNSQSSDSSDDGLIPVSLSEKLDTIVNKAVKDITVKSQSQVLKEATEHRETFIRTLNVHVGLPHIIRRNNIFDDVIRLYQEKGEELLKEYPFRIEFFGEKGIDTGGVSRDMFSAFYESSYVRVFDGSSLYCPFVSPEMDSKSLATVGFVISHGYLVAGILPTSIAFPCLAMALLGTEVTIPDDILFQCFMDSISVHELSIMKDAMSEVKRQLPSFSTVVSDGVLALFSRFNCRQIPIPATIERMVINSAKYEFLSKPAAAVMVLHKGIPKLHLSFWTKISVKDLYAIYNSLSVSTAMVLKMVEEAEGHNQSEERILSYLRQFIGNMGLNDLRQFVRFVTGTPTCSTLKINVSFNNVAGASRRPIAYTCSSSLILSTTYATYQEFVNEFQSCLSSEYAWRMDSA